MSHTAATRLARPLFALSLSLAAAALPVAASAQFATTNLQVLQGFDFEDSLLGYDTPSGKMTTLTLNHFSTWKYGDNFAFVDLYRGDFAGAESTVYAEWHTRIFVNRIRGKDRCLVVFKDFGPSFEVNQGPGFYAYLAGVGGDFALPIPGVVGVNLFYRYSSVQIPGNDIRDHTWQLSPYWSVPFAVGPASFVFAGFVDVSGAQDNEKVDVLTQPQLLLDVLGLAGGPKGKLFAGVEWYLHYNDLIAPDTLVSAPQAMLQWNLH